MRCSIGPMQVLQLVRKGCPTQARRALLFQRGRPRKPSQHHLARACHRREEGPRRCPRSDTQETVSWLCLSPFSFGLRAPELACNIMHAHAREPVPFFFVLGFPSRQGTLSEFRFCLRVARQRSKKSATNGTYCSRCSLSRAWRGVESERHGMAGVRCTLRDAVDAVGWALHISSETNRVLCHGTISLPRRCQGAHGATDGAGGGVGALGTLQLAKQARHHQSPLDPKHPPIPPMLPPLRGQTKSRKRSRRSRL